MNLNVMQDVVRSKQSLEASDQEEERMIITDDSSGNFDVEIDGSDEERDWGWLNCRPTCLQWLNTSRWMLTIVCVLTIFQGRENKTRKASNSTTTIRWHYPT